MEGGWLGAGGNICLTVRGPRLCPCDCKIKIEGDLFVTQGFLNLGAWAVLDLIPINAYLLLWEGCSE